MERKNLVNTIVDKYLCQHSIPRQVKQDIVMETMYIYAQKKGELCTGYLKTVMRNKVYQYLIRVMKERYYCGLPSRYLAWKQKVSERKRIYYQTHKEERNRYQKYYYRTHPKKMKEYRREYRKEYRQRDHVREQRRIYQKEYRKRPDVRERCKIYSKAYRAKLKARQA